MEFSIVGSWAQIVEDAVSSGRFASADEVVLEGLRLVQEREDRLATMRKRVGASLADPSPSLSDDEVGRRLRAVAAPLTRGDHA